MYIMAEEQDVEAVEAVTTPESTETNEQSQEQVEGVTSTDGGKDYKSIAEQLSKDIKEKNRKIQELKSQVTPPVTPSPSQSAQAVSQVSEDDTVRRFLQTEANATIAVKMQTDPSFKERVAIVQEYVAQGYDINMADRLAKADIMDKILTSTSEETPAKQTPKQITPQAIPEKQEFRETGDGLKDFLADPNVPEGAKEAVRRTFSDRM